jgi:hypothetical protein
MDNLFSPSDHQISNLMTAAKALVGFILSIITPYLANFGIRPDSTIEELLAVLVAGLITAAGIYFTPNKKPETE